MEQEVEMGHCCPCLTDRSGREPNPVVLPVSQLSPFLIFSGAYKQGSNPIAKWPR